MEKVKSKRLLSIFLVLIMMVQVFPLSAFAEGGISWSIPNENAVMGEEFDLLKEVNAVAEEGNELAVEISEITFADGNYVWNGTDTTITPETPGEYEVTYNAVNAADGTVMDTYSRTVTVNPAADTNGVENAEETEKATENGLPNDLLPRMGIRSGAADVTDAIIFSNGKLSTSTDGIIDNDSDDIMFTHGRVYTFTIDWAVNFNSLPGGATSLSAGDYFTFQLPKAFRNLSFSIGDISGTWGYVTVDQNGNGKVVFTDVVETKTQLDGDLMFKATYNVTNAGADEEWVFQFRGEIWEYSGSQGTKNPDNQGYTKDKVTKVGSKSGDYFSWVIYLNNLSEEWTGEITVEDTLGPNHKLATCQSTSSAYTYYGLDGQASNTPSGYFAIGVIDWERMRADYNRFVAHSLVEGSEVLMYQKPGETTWETSNYAYKNIGDPATHEITAGYTTFMRGVMRLWTTDSGFAYVSPYTNGLVSVTGAPGGFTIVFPDGAMNQQSLVLLYYTELSSGYTPQKLENTVNVSGVTNSVTGTYTNTGTGSVSGNAGTINVVKFDGGGNVTLAGAGFELTKNGTSYGPLTTLENGLASFNLYADGTNGYAGTYTLTEISTPTGYTGLNSPITLEIDSEGVITKVNDTVVTSGQDTDIYINNEKICTVINGGYQLHVYNRETPAVTSRVVTKKWNDANDQDGKRPNSIQVQLKADGDDYGPAVTLNAGNSWTHTWTGLPEKRNGQEVVYTVEETGVPTGYISNTSESGGNFTITNSYTPETVSVRGTKTWSDGNNQDGKRPASITVNLLANGKEIAENTVTANDDWEYEWSDLPKYDGGTEIVYTVTEDPVSDYSTTITGYDITNSYTPGETSRTVTKAWDDANDQDGKRPASIQVQLYADGIAYGSAVTLNGSNNWTYTWNNLPEKQGGQTVSYTVEEVSVPTDYTVSYSGTDGFAITNSHTTTTSTTPTANKGNPLSKSSKKTTTTTKPTTNSPATGDNTQLVWFLALYGLPLSGLVGLVAISRLRRRRKQYRGAI